MRTKYHQITLKDTFSDCQDMFWKIPLPFSSFSMILLTFPSSSSLIFTIPFTWLSGRNGLIPWRDSFLPLSFRKSFLSLQTHCPFFFLSSVENYGTSAASLKFPMPLYFPASRSPLNLISSRCFTRWSISPNRSAR